MDPTFVALFVLIVVLILCGVIWVRRRDIVSINLDIGKGKAAIEFSPAELKEIAEEIEESKPLIKQGTPYRPTRLPLKLFK